MYTHQSAANNNFRALKKCSRIFMVGGGVGGGLLIIILSINTKLMDEK